MTYRPATADDRPALVALLTQAELPTTDLPADLSTFLLAQSEEGDLIGAAGIEPLGEVGLLRSVAVSPDFRGQYIGQTLVDGLLQAAQHNGLTDVYLLTTTADAYFERLGFGYVSRNNVPEAIAQTQQFTTLCPDSSVVMQLTI
ncbi:arsenic resistance N-acetyltransferase ArsN2 [Fibrella sp. WM1]|uniref:arsenic resistance N-acetyltransferase ArsN2 n=1 Tax=Fibrella musci TaxID=3242485 RepID=UPI003522AB01